MLGKRIQVLRKRQGLSRQTLADRAGISPGELAAIEEQDTHQIPPRQLTRIADGLDLQQAAEFMALLALNGFSRRFQAYCLGLPKTGTVSITGIFGNYRSAHEFWQWDTHQMIIRYRHGRISRSELVTFLRDRDGAGCLEMDSAHFNRSYVDILANEFPEVTFICLIRDCYSWLSSTISYFTRPDREALQSQEMDNGMPFDLPRGDCEAKRELIRNFDRYIDRPVAHWAAEVRAMLGNLPAERSLVVRTHEIGERIEDMAALVGIPPDTLVRKNAHLNRQTYHVRILERYDPAFLQGVFDRHCGELMAAYFPGYTLEDYLNGHPIPPRTARHASHPPGGGPFPLTDGHTSSTPCISI